MWPAAVLAVTLPTLLAYNVAPSPTFLNQVLSYVGWGVWGLLLAAAAGRRARHGAARGDAGLAALLAAIALLAAAALAAPLWAALPWSLALSSAATLAAAAFVVVLGASVAQRGLAVPAFDAYAVALLAAGALGAALAVVQVFVPQWSDGRWIAAASDTGRAAGNLRQANHLSSLLLWGLVALVWLSERGRLGRWPAALLGAAMVGGVVLTASRTGIVGIGLLATVGAARPAAGAALARRAAARAAGLRWRCTARSPPGGSSTARRRAATPSSRAPTSPARASPSGRTRWR